MFIRQFILFPQVNEGYSRQTEQGVINNQQTTRAGFSLPGRNFNLRSFLNITLKLKIPFLQTLVL